MIVLAVELIRLPNLCVTEIATMRSSIADLTTCVVQSMSAPLVWVIWKFGPHARARYVRILK